MDFAITIEVVKAHKNYCKMMMVSTTSRRISLRNRILQQKCMLSWIYNETHFFEKEHVNTLQKY